MSTGVDYSSVVNKGAPVMQQDAVLQPGDTNAVPGEEGQWDKLSIKDLVLLLISKFQPGEIKQWRGQIHDPSKRLRIFLTALCIPVVLWILVTVIGSTSNSLLLRLLISTFLSSLTYLLTLWSYKFETKRESWYTVLLFPPSFVFVASLVLQLVFFYEFYRLSQVGIFIISIGIFVMGLYILLLALNIMNVSLFRYIPLVNSSYRAVFVFTLITIALTSFVGISIAQAGGLYWGGAVLGMMVLLFQPITVLIRLCMVSWPTIATIASSITLAIISVFLALGFWQISTAMIVLGMVMVGYIGLHLVIHHSRQAFHKWFYFEYLVIMVIFVGLMVADLARVW